MSYETNYEKELREAIAAGERAMSHLQMAESYLRSAKNWGWLDIFGGGAIVSFVKQNKVRTAMDEMQKVKLSLWNFQKELKDLSASGNMNVEIGNFLVFADFFFDNFMVDLFVQKKIAEMYDQVKNAEENVLRVLRELHKMNGTVIEERY